jgi:hypothetical protein
MVPLFVRITARTLLFIAVLLACWSCGRRAPAARGTTAAPAVSREDPSVFLEHEKLSSLYLGIENELTLTVRGVAADRITLTSARATIRPGDEAGRYLVIPDQAGALTIVAKEGERTLLAKDFRVQRIPDPITRLGRKADGSMGSGEFKAQPGLVAWLDDFPYDVRCQIQSYTLYYIRKRQDRVELKGTGRRFSGNVANAIRSAKPGDAYLFTEVKARCPGDTAGRRINGLAFVIK